MNLDRFKDFEPDVRNLVLSFENRQKGQGFFDVDQLEIIADYYLEVADIEGLEAAVTFGEQLYPANDEIRLRRAHLWSVTGQYNQALKLLQELEKKSPNDTDISYAIGTIYSMTDQPRKAIDYYLRAANDGYELDLIYAIVADEYYKLNQFSHAINYYRKAVNANPNNDHALFNLASTWDEQEQLDTAVVFFKQLVADHPFSAWGWYCLGCVHFWRAEYEPSADAYEYALAIDKTMYDAYIGLSDAYRHLGDLGRAVQALHDALPYTSERPFVLYSIGSIFRESGNYNTALSYYHESIKENPYYGLAWGDIGLCFETMGYKSDAEDHYRKAIDVEPDVDLHWLRLADFYLGGNEYRKACTLLENGRTDAADVYAFDYRLVICYQHMGRRNRMLHILRTIARQFPSLLPDLLSQCPELADDLDAMTIINSAKQE